MMSDVAALESAAFSNGGGVKQFQNSKKISQNIETSDWEGNGAFRGVGRKN